MITRRIVRLAVLAAAEVLCSNVWSVAGQDDEFVWFRCDACLATFFKVNKTMIERHGTRSSLPAFEFVETLEQICETGFTKDEFGVKQHEGKKYLFGPGIVDHIPDQGFGQMGMGDYDKRLQAYCRMFIEDVGEDELHRSFINPGVGIDKTSLCRTECSSPTSGTSGAPSDRPKKKRKSTTASTTTEPPVPKELWESPPPPPPPPRKAAGRKAPAPSKKAARAKAAAEERAPAPAPLSSVEEAVALLPRLSSLQLRWLGDAVLGELVQRATVAEKSTEPSGRAEL